MTDERKEVYLAVKVLFMDSDFYQTMYHLDYSTPKQSMVISLKAGSSDDAIKRMRGYKKSDWGNTALTSYIGGVEGGVGYPTRNRESASYFQRSCFFLGDEDLVFKQKVVNHLKSEQKSINTIRQYAEELSASTNITFILHHSYAYKGSSNPYPMEKGINLSIRHLINKKILSSVASKMQELDNQRQYNEEQATNINETMEIVDGLKND